MHLLCTCTYLIPPGSSTEGDSGTFSPHTIISDAHSIYHILVEFYRPRSRTMLFRYFYYSRFLRPHSPFHWSSGKHSPSTEAMKAAGYLSPCTSASSLSFLIAFTSSGERVISAPLAFSSTRSTLRQPGIGTTATISALATGKEVITHTVVVFG